MHLIKKTILSTIARKLNVKNLLVFLTLFILVFNSSPASSEDRRPCHGLNDGLFLKEFWQYIDDSSKRFIRNLPPNLNIPKDVVVNFFLTPDGFIRNAQIQESSGNENIDFHCLDAVYCSSPLPAPPAFRGPSPPPPLNSLSPPDLKGTGIYTFTFKATGANKRNIPESGNNNTFKFKKIPYEVLYRYPGLFTSSEIDAISNDAILHLNTRDLDVLRYQWALYYSSNPKVSKKQLLERASLIMDQKEKLLEWSRKFVP